MNFKFCNVSFETKFGLVLVDTLNFSVPLVRPTLSSVCLHGPASSDVSVLFHHIGASVMAPVTDQGIKGLKPLSPFLHRQLGQGNNSIWYFCAGKEPFSSPGFSSAPQPPLKDST